MGSLGARFLGNGGVPQGAWSYNERVAPLGDESQWDGGVSLGADK